MEKTKPPVNEGQPINLQVVGHGSKGNAFGKINNYVIFLKPPPGVTDGELIVGKEYSCVVERLTRTVGFANVPKMDGVDPSE